MIPGIAGFRRPAADRQTGKGSVANESSSAAPRARPLWMVCVYLLAGALTSGCQSSSSAKVDEPQEPAVEAAEVAENDIWWTFESMYRERRKMQEAAQQTDEAERD